MGNNVKKRFTVSLDIETKDLEKQVKGTVSNLKTLLTDLGSASDKMGYFKELVDYIGQIDSALVALRSNNKGAFDHMFDGLDANLKQEFEQIFGVAKDQLVVLDQLKDKLAALKSSGSATGADLKPLEQEVKSLYESLGMLDKLDMSGKGKIETRIKKLEAALEGFATVFSDVNAKIGKGLNFGSATGGKGNAIPDVAKDLDDQLKKMKNTVKKAVNDFYKELTKLSGPNSDVLYEIEESLQKALGMDNKEYHDIGIIFSKLEDGTIEADQAIKKINDTVVKFQKAKQDAMQTVSAGNTVTSSTAQPSLADAIEQETHEAISALDYGKKQLVKAWKEYYSAVQKAKNDGLDVESGVKSAKMSKAEASIQHMLDDFGIKATNASKWGIKTDLDLSEYIIDGDIGFDDIEEEINKLFDQYGASFDASIAEMRSKMGGSTSGISQDIVSDMDKVENKTNDVLSSFQKLVNYISQSGQKPGSIFDKLESGAKEVDDELKAILQSLNLIDSAGNINFNSITTGFTNKGGFVSDQYTMIARKIIGDHGQKYFEKSQTLQTKLADAQAAGAQIGAIFDLIKDEANGLFYEIQNTVAGTAAFSNDDNSVNLDVLQASEEQLANLAHTMKVLSDNGLFIDFGGSNILYDKDKGFSIIDLGLVGGYGHTVSKQNTLQENIDRFIEEYINFAPSSVHKDIQSVLADRLYAMAQNIDASIVNPNAPSKPAVQSQNVSKGTIASLEKEESAHKQNTEAIEAENAALKEQIDLKKKAQSMSWKEFAKDSSLIDAKHAEGLYTLGDMEHFWKQANYEKEVDFHELSQSEIEAILAKRGYTKDPYNGNLYDSKGKLTKGGATLDELIRSSDAYDLAAAWYSDQDFTAKSKMENMVLENVELRNIAMNKLYELYKHATNSTIDFNSFLDQAITAFRGEKTHHNEGPSIFSEDEILAFSMKKSVAQNFAGPGGTVVPTSIVPKTTMGSLSTDDFFDYEYEIQVPSHQLPEHDLYKNDQYKSFEDFYSQQKKEVQKGIDKYLIQVEKNRIADLLGGDIAETIENVASSGNYLQKFKHGIVPDTIKSSGGDYEDELSDMYNQSDEMQKRLIAYYASLASMDFGHYYTDPKQIGMTGMIGALTSDPTGVKKHVNNLTGEHQYNIFGQVSQDVIAEAEAHKKNTQAIQAEAKAKQQLSQTSVNTNIFDPDELKKQNKVVQGNIVDLATNLDKGEHFNNIYDLFNYINQIGKTVDIAPEVIPDNYSMNPKTGELTKVSDILALVNKLEQQYGDNLDFVKEHLQQVYTNFDFNANHKDVQGQFDAAYNTIDDIYNDAAYGSQLEADALALENKLEAIQHTYNSDPLKLLNGEYADFSGGTEDYSDLIYQLNAFEDKYGENLSQVWDYISSVFKHHIDAMNGMVPDLSGIVTIEDYDPTAETLDIESTFKDKLSAALKQLGTVANHASSEYMGDLMNIDTHLNWIDTDIENGESWLKDGKYEDTSGKLIDASSLNDSVSELEKKIGISLDAVHDYLQSVFTGYIQQVDDVIEITLNDDEPELDTTSIGQKYNDAMKNLQSLLDNSVNQSVIDMLDTIKANLDWVQYDIDNNPDVIQEGKYFNPSYEKLDYAALSDMATDFEGIYGESLEQVHDYIQTVFKKQFDEIDQLLGIKTDTTSMPTADTNKEAADLNKLATEVKEVEDAVQNKTAAFEQEGVIVGQVVDKEITALSELRVLLDDIQNYLQTIFGNNNYNLGNLDLSQDKINGSMDSSAFQNIQQALGQILSVLQGFTGIKSDHENSITYQEPVVDTPKVSYDDLTNKLTGDIATETTLTAVKAAIEQLSKSLTTKDNDNDVEKNLGVLVSSLSDSVKVLKDAANGIIQHQKAQKSDTSVAMAKIQDPKQNQIMSGVAKDAVKTLGLEAEVESLQALANGVVKVEGAFKNANGVWEGFTVKVNEHNQAVDLAVKKHSAFAKMLNSAKDDDDNAYVYNKEEVEARAKKHLEEYAAQGKKATVQFKDSGRYTITILEEIDGLTKQIFQTFDENDDKIERTTVTMSNNQRTKLENLQKKLIENGLSNGLISDQDSVYKNYQDASDELNQMTSLYSQLDNLSDAEIVKWKQQIALVQQLGNQVEGLVKQRKLANEQKIFESDKGKKLSKFDLDHATLQKDIAIPDSFTSRISDARSAIENATDADSLKIAINNWEALQNEIKKAAVEQDLYFKKTKQTSTGAKPSEFSKSLTSQKNVFEKYKNDVIDAAGVTDDLKDRLNELEAELGTIGDADGLDAWVQSFKVLQTDIFNAKNKFKIDKQAIATEISAKANSKFKETGFKKDDNNLTQEQQEIADKYKDLSKKIKEYNAQVGNSQDAEISGILATRDALYQLIDAYKAKHNIADNTYGAKQVATFDAKYNSLMTGAADVGLTSQHVAVKNLEDAYQNLQKAQAEFNASDNLQSEEGKKKVAAFLAAKQACNEYARELKKIVDTEKLLAAESVAFDPLESNFDDSELGRREALTNFMQSTYGANAAVEKFGDNCEELFFTVRNGDGTLTKMTATINEARTAIYATAGATEKVSTGFGTFVNSVASKFKSIIPYLTASFGWQEIWQQVRQGVTYVREIDSALTELKKVTNETDATYSRFLQSMSKTAGVVGSTVSELTTMAADWARLGYSMEEAGKLAKSTAILLNVSEFQDATAASEALISTMQAFQYTADDSQHVVDILNEVGNNYAVSSDGIAIALQDSASALMEAGNNLEQSVALVAAANKVVQDPNSVGSALRTISLRLRGTSVEVLEELGEETDGAVESVSKMQEKLKALTGVDILTDSGAYKDTYTILKDIAEVWDDMSNMDQAAALELMAGKNRANTLAAILNNIEDLEGAYNSALNAEGSAMRENAAYLDSIQGRIDLFNNALQTFWMNLLDTSAVKGIVDLGTYLMKMLDTVHGKIIAVVGALLVYKRFSDKITFSKMFEGAVQTLSQIVSGTKEATGATLAEAIARKTNNEELLEELLTKAGLLGVSGKLTKEQIKSAAATLSAAYANGKLTTSQYLATMASMGLKTALQGLGNVLKQNPMLIVAAVAAAAALAIDGFTTTAQEAADAAKEAFDEINGVVETTKSTIQSLESELSTLQSKIDELNGRELSFAEDQELERLKKQREELEHSLEVQKQLLALQNESKNKQAVASMKAYTKAASEGAEKTQKAWQTAGTIAGGVLAAAGVVASALIPGDFGTIGAAAVAGGKALASTGGIAAVTAGGFLGNKGGELAGSAVSANEGTYDSWYETYAKALETSREEEQKALEKYQKDTSDIKKLDKWQEAQQKTADIETEMYEHLSQMQQYFNGLEYGSDEAINKELDEWYTFLDKFSVDQGASGAKVTALDRIFGVNASEELQTLKQQIVDAVVAGEDFDFEGAINGSQELNNILKYVGITAEDVKNYFTQIGESAAAAAASSKIISFQTHSDLLSEVERYQEIMSQAEEIIGDNVKVTQDYKDTLIDLIGSEDKVNECFYEDNKLVVKNEKALKSLLRQVQNNISGNARLAKSHANLNYYKLVKQLNDTLNGTQRLDGATKNSIYTLLDQIDAVDRAIYKYQLLEDSLLGAHDAFSDFEQAKEIDSLNTYGDSYVDMAQTMYDGFYKTGKVGTEQFWSSVEALIPTEVYQSLTEDADRMKAIYDYYNKNVLPTLRLDEDQLSLDYDAVENFVKEGLESGVFTGDVENFDLVEGLNLEEAAEKLGYTKTQTYALFAELDKYNTSSTEGSFLSQLDDSLDGRIMNITNDIENLNRQKLALLEDGGYEENKEEIDSINQQLAQCNKNLKDAGIEAYNMWQEYAKNDVALTALETIENKQQEITKEGAATLGLEWDEVKGKTIQQVYDELLAKQQELGIPTELTVQFAKDRVDAELDIIEEKLKSKKIDIEANVVWNESRQQYEVSENSDYAGNADLQKYVDLSNEGYVLDGYLSDGLTTTETYLSNIESILKSIYDLQSGNKPDDISTDSQENKPDVVTENVEGKNKFGMNEDMAQSVIDNFANNSDSMFTMEQYEALESFFTDTIPDVAGNVGETLNKFFTETIPQEWEEFWASVGQSFDAFGSEVEEIYNIAKNFFTETVPAAWSEFWAGVGEKLNEIGNDTQELYGVVSVFFKETIPQKWEEFWSGVDDFLTEDVPYAIGYAAGVVAKFFTVTIPDKWDEFWEEVGEFINESVDKAEALCDAVEKFITETIPEKWDEFWEEVSDFYEEVIDPVIEDVKNALLTFFNETLPTKWNEFWDSVGEFFTETIPNAAENAKNAIITFFTVTIPEKWNEFWDGVGQFIDENIAPALSLLYDKLSTFFTVTVPEKWNGFWESVGVFFTQTIPGALQALGNKITEFFTTTIPTKWTEFWASVDAAFVTPIATAIQTIGNGITNFFTVTVPNAINGMWSSLASWISEKAASIWDNLTAGFTAGFGGGAGANGTAHASGTAHARGTAYKNGSWGAPKTETALVGELGPEMLVRNGRWTTVGDNGAEFTQVKKGDIIFNHKQTEDLLSKGYVTGRGKLHGGAFASGTAYSGLWKPTSPNTSQSNKPGNDFSDTGNRLFNAADSLSSAADSISSSASDAADEFREVFDWIEVRLEEINGDISLRSAQLENKIGYKDQNKVVDQMVDLNQKLYDNLISGANKYYAYAEKLLEKVPAEYRDAAQNGTIAIEEFAGETSEKTLEAIQEYREWVQKGDDATQQAEETLAEISNLAKQSIDNIAGDYDNKLSLRENETDQLDAYNALLETTYGAESEAIYKALININKDNINALQEQRNAMQQELNKQVEAGNIKKYSQDWYDAVNDIAALDTEIIELKTDLNDLQDSINELHWDKFDALISRLEAVSEEADNLIDILGNEKLVDEVGNWTDEGITSLGLYAQQMEAAEVQAKKYEKEIHYLNENWKDLGYTEQEYIDKLDDLKDGQYDAIKAYHDSKDAIVDLNKERVDAIKDGIEKEIDALEELINKKKEELDVDKDAHDFTKSIMEQEKNIADLQRQLRVLDGNNTASARAKKAQLLAEIAEAEAELQESYYDRSVSNQQEALDKELENFQKEKDKEMEGWDEYLENTEQVVADSLNTIQTNTDIVYQTLLAMGQEYGLSITESLTSPWKEGEYAIQSFSDQFGISMSATVEELTALELQFKETMLEIERAGKDSVKAVEESTKGYTSAEYKEPVVEAPAEKPKEEEKQITVGSKINAGSARIYANYNGTGGGSQYFASDPIYTVLQEKNGYLLVRHHKASSGVTGWFKKSDVKAYAKGTTNLNESGILNVDELGEELLVRAQNGRLTYMEKGSGIVPADLTTNLMKWGKLDPSIMLDQNRPSVGVHPEIHNTQIQIDNSIAELIHIDRCDQSTLPDVEKIVDKALEKHTQKLNQSLRKYTR